MAKLRALIAVALPVLMFATQAPAADYRLAPFKDDLFRYPHVLEMSHDGDYVRVDYNERRDLDERDAVKERKVKGEYVSLRPQWSERNMSFKAGGRTIKYIAAGKTRGGARAIVIYIHGQGGSRFQGANDWRFGGNFNRVKNLMTRNDGLFISTDFSDFGERGKNEIKALMKKHAGRSPRAPFFIACGSMGGALCWRLLEDPEAAEMMGGVLLLGSMWNNDFFKTPVLRQRSRRIPLYLGHGSNDTIFAWQSQAKFFKKIKRVSPGYPVKFVLFETGTHGTPIRMTDWRLVLNWMLKVGRK